MCLAQGNEPWETITNNGSTQARLQGSMLRGTANKPSATAGVVMRRTAGEFHFHTHKAGETHRASEESKGSGRWKELGSLWMTYV